MNAVVDKLNYIFWIWIGALFTGALIPGMGVGSIEIDSFSFRADYLLHALAFFGIVAIFAMARRNEVVIFKRFAWTKLILLCIFLGLTIEVLQHFIPGRTFNPIDMLFNLVGLTVGLLFFYIPSVCRS